MKPKHYTVREVAERLGVGQATAYRRIAEGLLKTEMVSPKPGLLPRRMVSAEALEAFIKEQTNAA